MADDHLEMTDSFPALYADEAGEPDGRTRFFGPWWDVPLLDGAVEVDAPVGEKCGLCGESVELGDRGLMRSFLDELDAELKIRPVHMECDMRSALGGIAHVEGRCSCNGGVTDPDDGLLFRESARRVMKHYERLRERPF